MARSGKWPVGAAQVGQRRGMAGVELCSASCGAWERKEEEGEGGKGRREKKKREKEKRKRKWRERERERAVGGVRGGGRPRARCGVWPVSDEHAEREKGKGEHKDGD